MSKNTRHGRGGSRRKRHIEMREAAFEKQGGRCFWCDEDVPRHHATADHVHARNFGGTNDANNIVMSCDGCNGARAKWQQAAMSECLT